MLQQPGWAGATTPPRLIVPSLVVLWLVSLVAGSLALRLHQEVREPEEGRMVLPPAVVVPGFQEQEQEIRQVAPLSSEQDGATG
jgi:hypothetical protein